MLQGDTYFQGIQAGLEEAVAADGGTVIPGISNGDPAAEFQLAQSMIQAQVDAVLMQPAADEASLPAMQAIRDAGITLICYGNCLGVTADPANVDGSIMSDNTALGTGTGTAAIAFIEENLGGKETIDLAILNCDIASACTLRKAGFIGALESAGYTVNVVSDQEGYLIDVATPVAQSILAANPGIDMMWASNEGGTAGAAIGSAGSGVPVFGTDISTQIAEFIIDPAGSLQATTGQDPVGTAKGAYEMAKVVLSGGTHSVFNVEIPGIVYDRANLATVEAFLAAN
jgi:simple sugar transport system substrate-binding protein